MLLLWAGKSVLHEGSGQRGACVLRSPGKGADRDLSLCTDVVEAAWCCAGHCMERGKCAWLGRDNKGKNEMR